MVPIALIEPRPRPDSPRRNMYAQVESFERRTLLSASSASLAGGLDATFGAGGIATIHVADRTNAPTDLLALPDGEALVLARLLSDPASGPYSALLRTTSGGALDPSFGRGGIALLLDSITASCVALTAGGQVLIGGETLGA